MKMNEDNDNSIVFKQNLCVPPLGTGFLYSYAVVVSPSQALTKLSLSQELNLIEVSP